MPGHPTDRPMLTILLATCETALKKFAAPDSSIDAELVAQPERLAACARQELEGLSP
jgi:hypothetical protein